MLRNALLIQLMFLFIPYQFACASNYSEIADEILHSYSKQMRKEYGLKVYGSGGRTYCDIHHIGIDYAYFDSISKEEARRLYVTVCEGLIQKYNENKKIRPYFHNFPVTENDIQVTIVFVNKQGNHFPLGSITGICVGNDGQLRYISEDPKTPVLQILYAEPYVEAVRIVLEEKNKLVAASGSNL